MTLKKKKVVLNIICVGDIVLIVFSIFAFKMSRVFTFNFYIFLVFAALTLAAIIYTILFYRKNKLKDEEIKPNIIILAMVLAVTAAFCDWVTTFSFEKWKNHEWMRQFMMDDFHNTQVFQKDNDCLLSKYTREETKNLLNVGSGKDRTPEITFRFVDDAANDFSADIYYAYKGLDGKEYWLVATYLGTDSSVKTDISNIYILPSGTNYEAGKIYYVDE